MEILEFNDKNSSSWLDRFKPMKINEIVGNYKAINQIIQWVKNFDKNRNEFFEKIKLLNLNKSNKKKKGKRDKINKDSENETVQETCEEPEENAENEDGDEESQKIILDCLVDQALESSKKDFVILDRCVLDNLAYTAWLNADGKVSDETQND